MIEKKIAPGFQVSLHFALKLSNGEIIDSTFTGNPVNFIVGDGNLPIEFEKYLYELSVGDHENFSIPAKSAFGLPSPMNVQRFPRDDFKEQDNLVPGMILMFKDAKQHELPGVVKNVQEGWVEIDFNHPLAGKDLQFEVKILAIGDSEIKDAN